MKSKKSKTGKALSDQKGFTLIELMVTISIVTFLAMVGVGTFSGSLPRYRLNATARDLVSDMRFARQLAATNNWQYAIQFFSPTSYNIVSGDQPLIKNSIIFPAYMDKDNVKAQTGVSWTTPATMPLFDPNGLIYSWTPAGNTLSAIAPDSIRLTDNAAPVHTKTVVISTGGKIRIQ